MRAPAPAYTANDGVIDAATSALGGSLLSSLDAVGEIALTVDRESLVETMIALRDTPGRRVTTSTASACCSARARANPI